MKLPNLELALVPEQKITGYLLSVTHRNGCSKSTFFTRFGFAAGDWAVMAAAERRHAVDNEVVDVEETPLGTSHTVEGRPEAPDGRMPHVRVVWFVETGEHVPLLVTAYPVKETADD